MPQDDQGREEATEFADTLRRHGDPDPDKWEKAEAVTGRPVDDVPENSTLASRAAANKKRGAKEVKEEQAEDKAVTSAATKARKPARKK